MKKRTVLILTVGLLAIGAAAGAAGIIQEIKAQLRPDFTVVIDGEERVFKNADGEVVHPVLYEGTTYLPVRAIGEIMDKIVYWFEDEKRIELKDSEKTTVTDADVIVPDEKNPPPEVTLPVQPAPKPEIKGNKNKVDKSAFIGEERAKEIALQKAGLAEADVKFLKVKLDRDDGVWKYEVEFRKDKKEYDADINAEDGTILGFEADFD